MEELKALIQKLKTNEEKVPEELLKTKYKKPYMELKKQVADQAEKILVEQSLNFLVAFKSDGDELVDKINKAIEDERRPDGIMKRISRALFKHKSVEEFEQLCGEMRTILWNLWIPYWQKSCCLYITKENLEEPYPSPKIYNLLTDEFLVDEEKNIWEKRPEWKVEQLTN